MIIKSIIKGKNKTYIANAYHQKYIYKANQLYERDNLFKYQFLTIKR